MLPEFQWLPSPSKEGPWAQVERGLKRTISLKCSIFWSGSNPRRLSWTVNYKKIPSIDELSIWKLVNLRKRTHRLEQKEIVQTPPLQDRHLLQQIVAAFLPGEARLKSKEIILWQRCPTKMIQTDLKSQVMMFKSLWGHHKANLFERHNKERNNIFNSRLDNQIC